MDTKMQKLGRKVHERIIPSWPVSSIILHASSMVDSGWNMSSRVFTPLCRKSTIIQNKPGELGFATSLYTLSGSYSTTRRAGAPRSHSRKKVPCVPSARLASTNQRPCAAYDDSLQDGFGVSLTFGHCSEGRRLYYCINVDSAPPKPAPSPICREATQQTH